MRGWVNACECVYEIERWWSEIKGRVSTSKGSLSTSNVHTYLGHGRKISVGNVSERGRVKEREEKRKEGKIERESKGRDEKKIMGYFREMIGERGRDGEIDEELDKERGREQLVELYERVWEEGKGERERELDKERKRVR